MIGTDELRGILLDVIRNDFQWWWKMPSHWREDRDLTLAAIRQEPCCKLL